MDSWQLGASMDRRKIKLISSLEWSWKEFMTSHPSLGSYRQLMAFPKGKISFRVAPPAGDHTPMEDLTPHCVWEAHTKSHQVGRAGR